MKLELNVYTDDSLTELKKTIEADRLRIPYRVAMYVAQCLDKLDIKNMDDVLKFVTSSTDKVDKVIKATFKISDSELECVDIMELGVVATEIYNYILEKINGMGKNEKNLETTV